VGCHSRVPSGAPLPAAGLSAASGLYTSRWAEGALPLRPLAGSDRAPGPSSLPVASAQAASGAGEPGLAVGFGRAPPLRGSGGSGSALAAGARSSACTRALAEHSPRALSARPSRPRDAGLDSTGSEPCGAGRFPPPTCGRWPSVRSEALTLNQPPNLKAIAKPTKVTPQKMRLAYSVARRRSRP
jgi:hypothetical protein